MPDSPTIARSLNATVPRFLGPDGTNSATATLTVITPHYLTWVGTADGTWSTVAGTDWFDTVAMAPAGFTTLDNVAFDNTGTATTVNITNAVQPVIVSVTSSSVNYTFSGNGKITGITGLTKSNGSTLTIQTTNDYTGVTTLNGGIVSVGQLAIGGSPSAIGAASSSSGNLVFNGGDLQYTGPTTGVDRGATLGTGGGTVEVTTAGNTLILGGVIAGTSSSGLVKAGNGTLLLNGANTYNSPVTVSAGVLGLSTNGSFGTGNITNNSALTFSGGSSANCTFVVPNNISGTGILTNDNSGDTEYFSGNQFLHRKCLFQWSRLVDICQLQCAGRNDQYHLVGHGHFSLHGPDLDQQRIHSLQRGTGVQGQQRHPHLGERQHHQ